MVTPQKLDYEFEQYENLPKLSNKNNLNTEIQKYKRRIDGLQKKLETRHKRIANLSKLLPES